MSSFSYPNSNQFIFPIPSSGGGSGITDLTGDVTATGPGAVAATIANDAVNSAKVRLDNNAGLRARDVADTADIVLIRLNSFDIIEIPDNTGTQAAIDITNRYLVSSTNVITANFENSTLKHSTGAPDGTAVLSWEAGTQSSPDGTVSHDWFLRTLKDEVGTDALVYANQNSVELRPTGGGTGRSISFISGDDDGTVTFRAPDVGNGDGSDFILPLVSNGINGTFQVDGANVITISSGLKDPTDVISLDYGARTAYGNDGNVCFAWETGVLVLPTGTSNPTSTTTGAAYFNTSDNTLRVYNGGWKTVTLT